jgi:hypothetical protein
MNFNQISSQLPKLIQKENKNEVDLSHKIEQEIKSLPISTNLAPYKIIYDSDWQSIEPVDIPGSASQVENLELPQRVPFEFTTNLEVPEVYLPFIDISLLTNPVGEQKVIGAGNFIYSGLQEVLIKEYVHHGIGEYLTPGADVVEFSDGGALPSPPAATVPLPFDADCYDRTVSFIKVSIQAQRASMTLHLTSNGTLSTDYDPPESTLTHIQSFLAEYSNIPGPGYHMGTLTWSFTQALEFKYKIPSPFPVPDDGKAAVPCGITTYREDGQYWELTGIVTFMQYIMQGNSYVDTKALFLSFYPDIFITPEEDGPPWKAYKRLNADNVESGNLKTKITKTDNNNFQFSVYGDILLVSPAIIETDYSDPDFPTYQPDADPLLVRLLVTFKDHPVNFTQTRMCNQ